MTQPLWTGAELLAATHGQISGTLPDVITGISIDSRTLEPGDAFFAITGERHDGHDHVRTALERGAAVAVVAANRYADLDGAEPVIVVPDVLKALEDLGRAARKRTSAKIIAVTGSVGKTSTKEMLRLALERDGATHASIKSFNNHWGVPLTLARMPRDSAYGVFEIGMNHAGEITPLAQMVRPHVAIITTVEPVHIEFFDGIEGIADAKAEIFAGLEPGGTAVLNADNGQFRRLAAAAREKGVEIGTFGSELGVDCRLLTCAVLPECSVATASVMGAEVAYRMAAPGRHLVQNSLAVLLAVKLVGADLALAALALGSFEAPAGRGQRHTIETPSGSAVLFDESYNANPASMRAALGLLGGTPVGRGRRIAVLGDMLELGEMSEELHRDLLPALVENRVDLVYVCGPQMRHLYDALPPELRGQWTAGSADMQETVLDAVSGGDAVVIKGSLGSRMAPIVEALIKRSDHLSQAEIAHA